DGHILRTKHERLAGCEDHLENDSRLDRANARRPSSSRDRIAADSSSNSRDTGKYEWCREENMKQPISVGVVGCGYWGPLLVRNLKGLPNCHLKIVCDLNEARLKHLRGLYPDVETGTDYQHLVNDPDLDAIVIATAVKHHHGLAKASLLAGKHTFIEKPMASSSAECEELIELAERKGLVLMIDHTFLYSSPVRKIVEIVEAGDIGDIRYINSRR